MEKIRVLVLAMACLCFNAACSKGPSTGDTQETGSSSKEAVSPTPAEEVKSYSGPFGLEMGLSTADVQRLIPSLTATEPGFYSSANAPTPHAAFESYILQFSEKSGLCAISAIGKDIESGQAGSEVRSSFDSLAQGLTTKYSQGKKFDFATGVMDDPQYWMIALSDKNRTLAQFWDKEEGSTLPSNLSSISLQAHASDMSTG